MLFYRHTSCLVTPLFILFQLYIFIFVSLIGVEDLDLSQDITTHLVSAAAPPPPPPPPKNAARKLVLALAESTQQVASVQSQSSGPCTPQSPKSSQDATYFQDSPQTLFNIFCDEGAVTRGSSPPLPTNPTPTAAPAPSCPVTSSPTIKQPPLDLPTAVIKLPVDTACSTQTASQCPGSPASASAARKAPEQQQGFAGQIPVQPSSSSNTPASNPSGSSRDSEVLEVRLISLIS